MQDDADIERRAEQVAAHVGFDRRSFVKRLVVTSAFTVPVVTSFSMSGVNSAFAQVVVNSGNLTRTD